MKLFSRLIAAIGSYGSLYGIYFSVEPLTDQKSPIHWALLIISLVLSCFLIIVELRSAYQERAKVYKGSKKINRYMASWVSKPGRTVIFSRDMSWAGDERASKALQAKAAAHELIVFVHHHTNQTQQLADLGAEVIEYAVAQYEPRSRFTIIGFGKEGSMVAVGSTSGDNHQVSEFRSGEHPVAAITEDLVRLLRGACQHV